MTTSLDSNTYDEYVNSSSIPVLVDFWAPWCGPCVKISPIIDALSIEMEGEISFAKVNVDDNAELPMRYEIASIPALLIFDKGANIGRVSIVGGINKDSMKEKIRTILAERGQ